MNAPNKPASSKRDRCVRWPWVVACIWQLLVSALTILNSVGLSRLTEHSRASAQNAHVQALATRVDGLEKQAEAVKLQPTPVIRADLDATRQELDERLSRVEQAQTADDSASGLQALQARVGAIEDRLKRTAPAMAVVPRREAEPPKPTVPEPPFNVIGLELRGGERLVSVAARGAASVREVRLLREGDTMGAWRLQAIEAHGAVFRIDGHTLRIAIP